MRLLPKRGQSRRVRFAVNVMLAALAIQNSAAAGKTITIVFFDGGSSGTIGGFSQNFQTLQTQLEAEGYTVTVVQYDSSGNLLNPNGLRTGQTIEEALADNPNLLNYTGCFSAGCTEVQYLLDTQDPTIYQLVAMDPYDDPLVALVPNPNDPDPLGLWPLTMHLDDWTQVQMVFSDGNFGPLLPGPSDYLGDLPYPVGGQLISVTSAPATNHEGLLDWYVNNNDALQGFTEVVESAMWSLPTPGDPLEGDPFEPGGPISGVPAAGGGGEESHVLTGVGTEAFRARSNDRYFHARP